VDVLVLVRAQRDVLTQKLEEVEAQLREAKADRKETERDRRMTSAVEQLKRLHSGMPHCRRLSACPHCVFPWALKSR
jgi:hypothetical protein